VDAGPNVHVICPQSEAKTVKEKLHEIEGVRDVLVAKAGGAAKIVKNNT
jgi:diphosphomevalonate decarboxylase